MALTVDGPGGTDTITRTHYITVSPQSVTTTITYGYDRLYRLTAAAYSSGEVYTYTYDEVGNRLAIGANGQVTGYQYDDANRLTQVGNVEYTWDDNPSPRSLRGLRANLLADGARSYTYDHANRLIAVVSGTVTMSFAYNGDGYRMSESVNGVTTTYVIAVLGLPQVLVETTGGEAIRYVFGQDLLAEQDGDAWAYHLDDGLGSVRQLADENGEVTLAQSYAPFGEPLWSKGSGATGFGFTGERWEAYTGLVFLRARYYEPGTGRFISKDPWPGARQNPVSLHSYQYADNSPLRYVDPLGLYSCLQHEQWPPDLVPLCLLLDSSLEARQLFYSTLVTVMDLMDWKDASVLLDHYLAGTGSAMYFGSGLVGLVEHDASSLIQSSRTKYLSFAAQVMAGGSGKLPRHDDTDFLSNTEGIPQSYAPNPYPVSRELFIAVGGIWFNRFYGGEVTKKNEAEYRISLSTVFSVDKLWSFAPNREMHPGVPLDQMPENPPAEFNFAEFLRIREWMGRPSWIPGTFISGPNAWRVYIPDEWAYSLETNGTAKSFQLQGLWARDEEFLAIDRDCNGWNVDEIVEGPVVIRELLPTSDRPSTSPGLLWFNRSQ